ncbi:hypothetical protein MWN34_04670 [Ancylobacter sp. 6x-1]|uniref:Uncharacterized protein n=1 Tax=Ancylobacter crimeensis TaxID=2579147 RepID=A0ABT0D8A9_9HYPH|nr:hypothetical protein [Ancylobacter crimeensis]MCK0196200.1 hypothetical protein [Ancylobacter crimeensis]
MEPYQIVRRDFIRNGTEWRLAPETLPEATRSWSSFCFFAPDEIGTSLRKRVDAVRTSFLIDILPADGGNWVLGGYNDLDRILVAWGHEVARG